MSRRQVVLLLGAVALVPLLFGTYVSISYKIALKSGRLPVTNEPEWIWWSVLAGLLVLGAYLVYQGVKSKLRLPLAGLYVIAMTVTLFGVHAWVACAFGDCF